MTQMQARSAAADATASPDAASPDAASPDAASPAASLAAPSMSLADISAFLFREARYADEQDYDAWESLWTDDAIYWVPAGSADSDPQTQVSVIYDNRRRISTRLAQLRTGKRFAQAPASHLRRLISNIEILGGQSGDGQGGDGQGGGGQVSAGQGKVGDVEVGANFLLLESRDRGTSLWGGRTTYRLRPTDGGIMLAMKKVVLVNLDQPLPTLGFLI
jgi:benzoate/toluate 1,2-dioxygenase subunit beta